MEKTMRHYINALKKYAVFNGRASRKEYWYFVLFYFLLMILFGIGDVILGTVHVESNTGLLSSLFILAMLIPGMAVAIRRLHDTDRSGWWILINLIPLIGLLVFMYFMVSGSDGGENQYGPSPLGTDGE